MDIIKKFGILLLFFSLFGGFSACSEDKDEAPAPEQKPDEKPEKEPELILEGELDRVVPTKGKTISIVFTASGHWTISSSEKWCSFSDMQGEAGKKTVEATLVTNDSYDDRSTVVTIAMGKLSRQVKITQVKKNAILVAKNEYVLTSQASEQELEVQTNMDSYKVTFGADWMNEVQDTSRGLNTYKLKFSVKENAAYDPRESTITVEADTIKQVIRVVQAQKDAIVAAKSIYEVDDKEQYLEFMVSANVEFQVSISSNWIESSPASRGLTEYAQRFRIKANPTPEQREGTITYIAGDLKQTVKVVQSAGEYVPVFKLKMTFEGSSFKVPTFTGTDILGRILWGDGVEEDYSVDATHAYQSDGGREVIMEMQHATEIKISSLKGVSHITFSHPKETEKK